MEFIFILIIGIAAGFVDIIPMILQKIDKYSTISAFVFHLIAPFILFYLKIEISIWLKGGIIYLLLAIPTIILVARDDKKTVPIMITSSIVIGTIVSFLESML